MKALPFLFMFLALGLAAGQDDNEYPTTPEMKAATIRVDYPRVKVGDHVLHLSPDTVISDLNFFLRVYGGRLAALQELATGLAAQRDIAARTTDMGESERAQKEIERLEARNNYLQEDYQRAWNDLITVISNFERSLAEGSLKGWTYLQLVERAVRGHIPRAGTGEEARKWYVAARFFLHRWMRENPGQIRPAFEARINEIRESAALIQEKMKQLITQAAEYTRDLNAINAQIAQIETQARQVAPNMRAQLDSLYKQLLQLQTQAQQRRGVFERQIIPLHEQMRALNQDILFQSELYNFLREFFTEYRLWEQHGWQAQEQGQLEMPAEALVAMHQALPAPTRDLWLRLFAPQQTQQTPAVQTTTVRPPAVQPATVPPPVGRVGTRPRQIQQPQIFDNPTIQLNAGSPQTRQAQRAQSPGIFATVFGFGGASSSPK